MSTDIDWREELDSSFGNGSDRPAADYLVSGRAALRRRRTAMGTTALVTLIAIGSTGWALAPGGEDVRDSTIASDAPSPSVASPTTPPAAEVPWLKGDAPARVDPVVGLEIRDGAVVHERRDDLYPGKDTRSVALDLSFEGEQWWVLLEWDDGGSTYSGGNAGDMWDTFHSFDAFVAASTSDGGMFTPDPDPVADKYPYGRVLSYGLDGVVLRPGATIVRRVDNPHAVTPPEKSVGLVVEFEGDTTWLSLTASPKGGGGTWEKATESGWTDFDQWLAADVALQKGDPQVSPVTIDDEGGLTPAEPGVEILDQRSDPDLPAYTDASSTASGVAMITWQGETWFVLVVRFPDQDSVTTFAASKADGASSIDEFIEFATARADEGGGLR